MRLATAVGQTHGCYFVNNLSCICYLVISTCFFQVSIRLYIKYRAQKYKIFRKNSRYI